MLRVHVVARKTSASAISCSIAAWSAPPPQLLLELEAATARPQSQVRENQSHRRSVRPVLNAESLTSEQMAS